MLGHKQGVGGDCIHLSRASLAVRFLGHEKKRLSHFIRSTWNNYCVQCGDVAGNTNSAVLFDIFIAEHLFTSSCVRVFWTCPENGTFGWLVSHTEWRLIEIIWLCLWSRIGGGGQACNFIELHRSALYWALYMLCTIYCASLGFTWLHALQCNVFWSSASYCTAFACTHAFKQDKCFAVQKDCPSGGWHSAADSLSNGLFSWHSAPMLLWQKSYSVVACTLPLYGKNITATSLVG